MPKITSKKDIKGGLIHPSSRKAVQLQRVQLRAGKLADMKQRRAITQVYPLLDRITSFQFSLDPGVATFGPEDISRMITTHIERNDDRMHEMKTGKRPGRPLPKECDQMQFLKKNEMDEYVMNGFQIPDLGDADNVRALRAWDGTKEGLGAVKLVRVKPIKHLGSTK